MKYMIKTISSYYADDLQNKVNEFFSINTDIELIDIKFDAQHDTKDSMAFIIYKSETEY